MQIVPGIYNRKRRDQLTLVSGETTPWQLVDINGASVSVVPTGGAITVQFSRDPMTTVQNDNANGTSLSTAFNWPLGAVTIPSALDFTRITAVRFVVAAGASGTAYISE